MYSPSTDMTASSIVLSNSQEETDLAFFLKCQTMPFLNVISVWFLDFDCENILLRFLLVLPFQNFTAVAAQDYDNPKVKPSSSANAIYSMAIRYGVLALRLTLFLLTCISQRPYNAYFRKLVSSRNTFLVFLFHKSIFTVEV